jgi:hypothetical protein
LWIELFENMDKFMSKNTFKSAVNITGEEFFDGIKNLSKMAGAKFLKRVEKIIEEKKKAATSKSITTREELVRNFSAFGYQVPTNAKFYKTDSRLKQIENCYGMQIGQYVHSCHIDTTDFIVLLMVNDHESWVEEFDGCWMKELK